MTGESKIPRLCQDKSSSHSIGGRPVSNVEALTALRYLCKSSMHGSGLGLGLTASRMVVLDRSREELAFGLSDWMLENQVQRGWYFQSAQRNEYPFHVNN